MSSSPLVSRLQPLGETIFATMTMRAQKFGAINLGQGFPLDNGPQLMLDEACRQLQAGNNQYGHPRGDQQLRAAIAAQREQRYGLRYDPDTEILVTVGATEAIAATVLALVEPGSEVIVFEPYYDAYAAAIALAGAKRIAVPLGDLAALEAAITPRTRLLIINSPHNPTGTMLAEETLAGIARLACRHDFLVLADEVYEYLTYGEHVHRPLALQPGMKERTITVSSAAKTFNLTGWKTGWVLAKAELVTAIVTAKQFLSYVGVTPLQPAVAVGLTQCMDWVEENRQRFAARAQLLQEALAAIGLEPSQPAGTYFLTTDISALGYRSGLDFCLALPEKAGVAAIPMQVFCDSHRADQLVRWAFCWPEEKIQEAGRRLAAAFQH